MDISVINHAGVDNKYIRLALWKLYRLEEKFPNLRGSQLTILKENPKKNVFRVMLQLSTIGETIVLKQQAKSISKIENMKFHSRKLIKPGDLNANNTLFGGQLLRWIDEEAGIYAMTKLDSRRTVTKYISEINFISSARQADTIEIGLEFSEIGRSSITFRCEVRNLITKNTIIRIEKIVFVNVDENDRPLAHGKTIEDITKYLVAV